MTGFRSLTRRSLVAGAAAATALALPRAVAQAQPRGYDLLPQEVAAGLWMITGAPESFARSNGGAIVNIVLLASAEGAIIIDTGSTARMGAEIRTFADQRLGGVARVINTHHHPDHWFGNIAFADRPILALPATGDLCRRSAPDYAASLYALLGPWMAGTTPTPPDQRIETDTLQIGGRTLRLLALSGHSAADLVVQDVQTGVLIAGDLLFLDRAPSFPDADVALWLRALDRLAGLETSGVVPGHGPFHRSGAALAQTRQYLELTRDRLDQAAALGLSPVEAMAAGPAPAFRALGANPEEYIRTVAQRWADHERTALPVIGGL